MSAELATELEAYKALLPSLLGDEGRFVVICGTEKIGVFEAYSDALSAGYQKCGVKPFLVKRISAVESIAYFTRDLDQPCPT